MIIYLPGDRVYVREAGRVGTVVGVSSSHAPLYDVRVDPIAGFSNEDYRNLPGGALHPAAEPRPQGIFQIAPLRDPCRLGPIEQARALALDRSATRPPS